MENEFLEAFAFSDRRAALEQLIPGTDDHYFYACLDLQHAGDLAGVDRLLTAWMHQHGETQRLWQIRDRQALLRADKTPDQTFGYLKDRLNLGFHHHKETEAREKDLPTRLDASLISRQTLSARALQRHNQAIDGFTDRALDWLAAEKLSDHARRQLLDRLERPDHKNLVTLILADLDWNREPRRFGSRGVHAKLLLDQLRDLASKRPQLLSEPEFVHTWITRLSPSPDIDWEHNPDEHRAYLDRLWAFAQTLPRSFNSLRAHIVLNRMHFDRNCGEYTRSRFEDFLDLPVMQGAYADRERIKREKKQDPSSLANPVADYAAVTLLPPVRDHEALVAEYLTHFFAAGARVEEFSNRLNAGFLRRTYAITMITRGIGQQDQWYAMLEDPAYYQELKESVAIDLAPNNPEIVERDAPVTLHADVKNVPKLVVKVFEINAFNYFQAHERDVSTSIDLDGLVASEETVHEYGEPSQRIVRRTLELRSIDRPGTYVVELIGNGKSSRALIQKGSLRYVERIGAAGHVLTVLDEMNRVVEGATVWLGGKEYASTEGDGHIRIPFTTHPRQVRILLRSGDLATVDNFQHLGETYSLWAGVYVDREQLIEGRKAEVAIRPVLYLNKRPVSLELLEDTTLSIETTDGTDIGSTKELAVSLPKDGATLVETFSVPSSLRTLRVTLKGKVRLMSAQRDQELSAQSAFELNGIDATELVEDIHLEKSTKGYTLHVLGKTGETIPACGVNLSLEHEDFFDSIDVELKTNPTGQVELGELVGITRFQAETEKGAERSFELTDGHARYPASIHAKQGAPIVVPYLPSTGADSKPGLLGLLRRAIVGPERSPLSLLERASSGYRSDRSDRVRIREGLVEIDGLEAGDYELFIKDSCTPIELRVSSGRVEGRWLVSDKRLLETKSPNPLTLRGVRLDDDKLEITVGGGTSDTRVHLFAHRFVPAYSAPHAFDASPGPDPRSVGVPKALSRYVSGRDIGEEYRYILERKYREKLPGIELDRPALLLNPWSIRKTSTETQDAAAGGMYGASAEGAGRIEASESLGGGGGGSDTGAESNLDFLSRSSASVYNLVPDESGRVRVAKSLLGAAGSVRIVAVDREGIVSRDVALPSPDDPYRDLRQSLGLDPAEHYTQRNLITTLPSGERLVIEDISTAQVEIYDTLAKVFRLFQTLSDDRKLDELAFVLEWPKLDETQKRDKYSRFACHELNFFLHQKDRPFFEAVVRPYLAHKKDKTFLDRFLIDEDLREYLEPWAYGRLNIVERILLSRRVDSEDGATRRHVGDLFDLLPPDIDRKNHLFKTALRGSALETEGIGAAFGEQKELAKAKKKDAARSRGAPAPSRRAAPMQMAKAASLAMAPPAEAEMERMAFAEEAADDGGDFYDDESSDLRARDEASPLFRQLDKTEEWAENNYYHLRMSAQGPDLIRVNAFWRDYARHDQVTPFLSKFFAEAAGNLAEMMFALSVLDLPFTAESPDIQYADGAMEITAKTPAVVFHQEIRSTKSTDAPVPILVNQNYFDKNDRWDYSGPEQFEKYVRDEFVVRRPFVCQVVITNPTATRQKLDLLLQIPMGAMPLEDGFFTTGRHVELDPYATHSEEYAFYFPHAGAFSHYPVHVSRNEELLTFAAPFELNVVEKASTRDPHAWAHVSQHGTSEEVLRFLERNNIDRVDLEKIAWRMHDRSTYQAVLDLLAKRHVYHPTLWSYAILHRDTQRVQDYLEHISESFLAGLGSYLDSPLLEIDAVRRGWYEHLEYAPLVNARAHQLGAKRKVLNSVFAEQYSRFLAACCYLPTPGDDQLLACAYYYLLQDRYTEARALIDRVEAGSTPAKLQLAYINAYMSMLAGDPEAARAMAAPLAEHPVDRWRKRFENVLAQIDELSGGEAKMIDPDDREQLQARLARSEPSLQLTIDGETIVLDYANLETCRINYYLMDIELLFSRQPFVDQKSDRFSMIKPNRSDLIELATDSHERRMRLPEALDKQNVIIEVEAKGIRRAAAIYSHSLIVSITELYGRVAVASRRTREPLPKTYIKVYAEMAGGEVKFYKDGYTDLRGRFDYASLSTDQLDHVERFSILVLNEELGSVIKEARPPHR